MAALVRSSVLGWQIEGAHGAGSECAEGFGSTVPAEDFDGGDPDRPRHFQGFGAGHKLLAGRGREEIDLDLDRNADPSRRRARSNGNSGRMVGQRGNDPTVKMTEELHQVFPACQGDFGVSRLNRDDAETGGVAKALRVDGLGEARRVQGGAQDAGLFTLECAPARIRCPARN